MNPILHSLAFRQLLGVARLVAMTGLLGTLSLVQADATTNAPGAQTAHVKRTARPTTAAGRAGLDAARREALAHLRREAAQPAAPPAETRVAAATNAEALFAARSWFQPPPPPPPPPPAPPVAPTAPPFPYTFVGSYAPVGEPPVYFLARNDRLTDAHVGDRLDGIYEFESADNGQLTFNYTPLSIRQTLETGVSNENPQ